VRGSIISAFRREWGAEECETVLTERPVLRTRQLQGGTEAPLQAPDRLATGCATREYWRNGARLGSIPADGEGDYRVRTVVQALLSRSALAMETATHFALQNNEDRNLKVD
jgi:hypothetical protein